MFRLRRVLLSSGFALVALLAFANPSTAAPQFAVTQIGDLGYGPTQALALNASGQVVGFSMALTGYNEAYITGPQGLGTRSLGTMNGLSSIAFDVNDAGRATGVVVTHGPIGQAFITEPQGESLRAIALNQHYSVGYGINNSGQIAGAFRTGYQEPYQSFRTLENGASPSGITPVNVLPNLAYGITDRGQAVGTWLNSSGFQQSFLTSEDGTSITLIDGLGGSDTAAVALNIYGQVVGHSLNSNSQYHAYITGPNGAGTQAIAEFDGDSSAAFGVNTFGQTVGSFVNREGIEQAFFSTAPGEEWINLSTLSNTIGLKLSRARDINDAGQIIVNSSDGRAFLLSPIPEVGTLPMFFAGLLLFARFKTSTKRAD